MPNTDMNCDAPPPVHRFLVNKNSSQGSDLYTNPPQRMHTNHIQDSRQYQKTPNMASSSADASIIGVTRPSSRVLTPTLKQGDSDSTLPLTHNNSSSKKSQHLSMSDIINVSPAKGYSMLMSNIASGLPSSPLTKISKAITTNSSRGAMTNYTYDFTSTTHNDKHQSSPNETTVVPFEMELRPQVPRKFDGGSSIFNSSFLKKNKPFPITQFSSTAIAPPRSDEFQNMPNHQLILSDDLILSRFDTSFPEPKPIQELFAFDENFPSSTPLVPSDLPSTPYTAGKTTTSFSKYSGKVPPTSKLPMTPSKVAKSSQAPKSTTTKSNARALAKKSTASKVTKPKTKNAGKRPPESKGPYSPTVSAPDTKMTRSPSCSPPPTLPPPTPLNHESSCKVPLPSISHLLKSDVSESSNDDKEGILTHKEKSGRENGTNTHAMCLRNRKQTDYTHHISLSQLSGASNNSSPISTQSSQASIYDPALTSNPKKPLKSNPTSSNPFPSSSFRYYSAHKKPPVKRTRVFLAGRSKNGCWTCRIRKKKCTEEKPHCFQCEKLGLRCDGYSDERPMFMDTSSSQRNRLDEIKAQTSKIKKVGVKKSFMRG